MRAGIVLAFAAMATVVSPTSFAGMYVCVGASGARTVQDHACEASDAQRKAASLHREPVAGVVYARWARDLQISSVNPASLQAGIISHAR